jgi:hypothetical protein
MTVQPMLPVHARDLAALQKVVFPTLAAADRMNIISNGLPAFAPILHLLPSKR